MFRPVRMERLSAVLLGADARAALRGLGSLGAVELIPGRAGPDGAPLGPPDNAAALARCGELLARAGELRCALGRPAAAEFAGAEPEPAEGQPGAAEELSGLEAEARMLLEKNSQAAAELAAAAAGGKKLAPYAGLPLPGELLKNSRFLRCAAGSVPAENLPALLDKGKDKFFLLPLPGEAGRARLLALAGPVSGPELGAALAAACFRSEEPPAPPGLTLAAAAEAYAAGEKLAGEELAAAQKALEEFAVRCLPRLAAVERAAREEALLLEAEQCLPRTASAALVSGWAPAGEAAKVSAVLNAAAGGRCAVETAPPGEGAPVLLRPPGPFRPFARLVAAYGLPGYGDADPTAFSAVIYVLLFGAMFGDFGQGAVVCAAGAWLAGRGRSAAARDGGRMAFWCGLAGMFFGLVYGSCFGLPRLHRYALWRDPLAGDPLALVLLAMAAGAAVISSGVILNIINRVRSGDLPGAVLDRFGAAGLLFYWPALLALSGKIRMGTALPAICLALACWVLNGPALYLTRRGSKEEGGEDGFIGAAAEGLVGAFEGALLYLSNTVSFARLAAYAMSHAALLAAAYLLAAAADKVWGTGSLPGLLAIIAGNAAAIALEGVVAAVQALRLEYYEFFGKFFAGDGRPFRPFTLVTGRVI